MKVFVAVLVIVAVFGCLLALEPQSQTSLINPLPPNTPASIPSARQAPGWEFVWPPVDDYATVQAMIATVGPP